MTELIYIFHEGNKNCIDLLGNKGSMLCEMNNLGLPVPPGFIITAKTFLKFSQRIEALPDCLKEAIKLSVKKIENETSECFGSSIKPLLFSVRSGGVASMPGMLDTVLNVGINAKIAEGLEHKTGKTFFAYDTYIRFLKMFIKTIKNIPIYPFEKLISDFYRSNTQNLNLLKKKFQAICERIESETKIPSDPYEQLYMAVEAVFSSWNKPKAIKYREYNKISDKSGMAVIVQKMVFGNLGSHSGSGVMFSRNPSTGRKILTGEYFRNVQGDDLMSGLITPDSIEALRTGNPAIYEKLCFIQKKLENHFKEMQEIEFVHENKKLYILQARTGKRTNEASIKIASDMLKEGLINKEMYLSRVKAKKINKRKAVLSDALCYPIAKGLAASPGVVAGRVVFSADDAEKYSKTGEEIILMRDKTTTDDIVGIKAAKGLVTAIGGITSHAAVISRAMGKTCITGCADLIINFSEQSFKTENIQEKIKKLEVITIDGNSGLVYLGDVTKK